MNRKLAFSAGAVALLAATAALAQAGPDFTLNPTFGEVTLEGGFTPDPHTMALVAGGEIDAATANLGAGCGGFIAAAPDYRLQYSPTTYPLTILALADADTTLVVNGPDGAWYCDDDSWGELNPLVTFASPMAGQYDIWIGVYGEEASMGDALLIITESDPSNIPAPADAAAGLAAR